MASIHVVEKYKPKALTIHRSVPRQRGPLVLGPEIIIRRIRNMNTSLGNGFSNITLSPLWGGWKYKPEERGNNDLERVIRGFTQHVFPNGDYVAGFQRGDLDLRHLQLEVGAIPVRTYTAMQDVGDLIEAQAVASLMSVLADSEAIAQKRPIWAYFDSIFKNDLFIPFDPDRQVLPALTVGGKSEVAEVRQDIIKYGERGLVKYKIGTRADWQKDLELIVDVQRLVVNPETFFIMDNNQAYAPEDCALLLDGLNRENLLDRVLFIEQPFKRGEEKAGMKVLAKYVRDGVKVSFDESISSSEDVYTLKENLKGVIAQKYFKNLVIVPKIEKGGLVEFMEIVNAAKECGFMVSPSTLTGSPLQYALFAELVGMLDNVVTLPGGKQVPVEANGYEIYEWETIKGYSVEPQSSIFDFKPTMPVHDMSYHGIPPAARSNNYRTHRMTQKRAIIRA